jgi:Concanavalin A-like lectin/glucanases superfamily
MAFQGPEAAVWTRNPGISPYPPMTISAWLYFPVVSAGGTEYFFQITGINSGGGASYFNLHYVGLGNSGSPYEWGSVAGQFSSGSIDCFGGLVGGSNNGVGFWNHCVSVMQSTGTPGQCTTVSLYNNGVHSGDYTSGGPLNGFTSSQPGGSQTNQVGTGATYFGSGAGTGAAVVGPCMVWNSALSQAQITSLSKGQDPRKIMPQNLVSLCRFAGENMSTQPDICGPHYVSSGGVFTPYRSSPPILWAGSRGRGGY